MGKFEIQISYRSFALSGRSTALHPRAFLLTDAAPKLKAICKSSYHRRAVRPVVLLNAPSAMRIALVILILLFRLSSSSSITREDMRYIRKYHRPVYRQKVFRYKCFKITTVINENFKYKPLDKV